MFPNLLTTIAPLLSLTLLLHPTLVLSQEEICAPGCNLVCCPSCLSSGGDSAPCADRIPITGLDQCTAEAYPTGWVCCIGDTSGDFGCIPSVANSTTSEFGSESDNMVAALLRNSMVNKMIISGNGKEAQKME